jgi:Enzyme involved in the deoxyxylulose pathway of isoprenoid biosynthesis
MLLAEGIGDTLRVSLTRDPLEEIRVAYEILRALNIRRRGPEIISCPTCGRTAIPLLEIVDSVEKRSGFATNTVKTLVEIGHTVYVESNAGIRASYDDEQYKKFGAIISNKKIF